MPRNGWLARAEKVRFPPFAPDAALSFNVVPAGGKVPVLVNPPDRAAAEALLKEIYPDARAIKGRNSKRANRGASGKLAHRLGSA